MAFGGESRGRLPRFMGIGPLGMDRGLRSRIVRRRPVRFKLVGGLAIVPRVGVGQQFCVGERPVLLLIDGLSSRR